MGSTLLTSDGPDSVPFGLLIRRVAFVQLREIYHPVAGDAGEIGHVNMQRINFLAGENHFWRQLRINRADYGRAVVS